MAKVDEALDRLGLRAFELRSEIDVLIEKGPDIMGAKSAHEEDSLRTSHQQLIDQKRKEMQRLLVEMSRLERE